MGQGPLSTHVSPAPKHSVSESEAGAAAFLPNWVSSYSRVQHAAGDDGDGGVGTWELVAWWAVTRPWGLRVGESEIGIMETTRQEQSKLEVRVWAIKVGYRT